MKFVSSIIIFMLCLSVFSNPVAVLTYFKGNVDILSKGTTISAETGLKLEADDSVKTGKKSKVRLVFCAPEFSGTISIGPDSLKLMNEYLNPQTKDPTLTNLASNIVDAFREKEVGIEVAGAIRSGKIERSTRYKSDASLKESDEDLSFNREFKDIDLEKKLVFPTSKPKKMCINSIESEVLTSKIASLQTNNFQTLIIYPSGKISEKPQKFVISINKGSKDINQGNYFIAQENERSILQKSLLSFEKSEDEEDPTVFLLRGNVYYQQGFYSEALLEYRNYIIHDPESNKWAWTLAKKAIDKLNLNITHEDLQLLKEFRE